MQGKHVKFFSFENIHLFRFICFVTMGDRLFFGSDGGQPSVLNLVNLKRWKSPPLSVHRVGDGLEGGHTTACELVDRLQQKPSVGAV